jgi:hypothetical protein
LLGTYGLFWSNIHLVGAQFNFPLPIISLNSSSPEIMVTGLTEIIRLKQEIISIVEHETCSFDDQCVTTTVRIIIIIIKMREYLYCLAVLILYSVFV